MSLVLAMITHVTPGDLPLPDFLNPLLDYIQDNVPAPVYSLLLNFLSHALALFSAVFNLAASMLSKNPMHWDAQTVIPPVIAVLTAYLALISLYRTTSWMFRTSIWFLKWGTIFGALIAATGWVMGSRSSDIGSASVLSGLGGLAWQAFMGETTKRPQRSSRRRREKRPNRKVWERFETEQEQEQSEPGDLVDVLKQVFLSAEQIMASGNWWEAARAAAGLKNEDVGTDSRKAEARTKGSKSR